MWAKIKGFQANAWHILTTFKNAHQSKENLGLRKGRHEVSVTVWAKDSEASEVGEDTFILLMNAHYAVQLKALSLARTLSYPPHATVGQQVGDTLGRVIFLGHTEDFPHASEGHFHGGAGQGTACGLSQPPERVSRDEEDHP